MSEARKLDWLNIFNAVFGVVAVVYLALTGNWHWLWWTLGIYVVLSVFGNSVGFHRYVAHRSYDTYLPIRWFLLYCGSMMSLGSPITWTMVHRTHHMYPDREGDPHSPRLLGFYRAWLSIGWNLKKCSPRSIRDLAREKDVQFFHRNYFKIVLGTASVLLVIDWHLFLFVYALPSALMWVIFGFASAWCHTGGYRNYEIEDASTNSLMIAWLFVGEGFHNNHHLRPNDWNNWDRWWEFDLPALIISLIRKPRSVCSRIVN